MCEAHISCLWPAMLSDQLELWAPVQVVAGDSQGAGDTVTAAWQVAV